MKKYDIGFPYEWTCLYYKDSPLSLLNYQLEYWQKQCVLRQKIINYLYKNYIKEKR